MFVNETQFLSKMYTGAYFSYVHSIVSTTIWTPFCLKVSEREIGFFPIFAKKIVIEKSRFFCVWQKSATPLFVVIKVSVSHHNFEVKTSRLMFTKHKKFAVDFRIVGLTIPELRDKYGRRKWWVLKRCWFICTRFWIWVLRKKRSESQKIGQKKLTICRTR